MAIFHDAMFAAIFGVVAAGWVLGGIAARRAEHPNLLIVTLVTAALAGQWIYWIIAY